MLLSLAVMGVESTAAWSGFVTDMANRGLKRIELAIVDGNKGLTRALLELWPNLPIQRCTCTSSGTCSGTPQNRCRPR